MINTPSSLQDLRRSLYVKAKAERSWRFWGVYVHVCKRETLQDAYAMAKENKGAPGIDGVTFEAIEESGVESFLQLAPARSWGGLARNGGVSSSTIPPRVPFLRRKGGIAACFPRRRSAQLPTVATKWKSRLTSGIFR